MHRLNSVLMTGESSSRPPEGFSLDAFLEQGGVQFGEGGTIRLKAMVSNKLACYLAESPLTTDQKLIARAKTGTSSRRPSKTPGNCNSGCFPKGLKLRSCNRRR